MISRIEITGLGPHKSLKLALDPKGTTTVSGPSEIGKTTILESILLTLLGRGSSGRFQPEAIHDAAERAEVRLTLDDGRTLKRTVTRSKSVGRSIISDGRRQSYTSETRYADALGSLVADPEATRLIVAPLAWQPLVASNARPFRDLLTRAMPSADPSTVIVEILEEFGVDFSDEEIVWTEKDAMKARRDARRRKSELTGQIQALDNQIATLQADVAAPAEPLAAKATMDAETAWTRWERASQQAALAGEHARRRAALGAPPTLPTPIEQLTGAERSAQANLQIATEAWRAAQQRHDQLQRQLQAIDMDQPDRCPTCGRPGWDAGAARAAALDEQLQIARKQLDDGVELGKQARTTYEAVTAALDEGRQIMAKQQAWQSAVAALGPAPSTDTSQPPPETRRPTEDELTAAQDAISTYTAARGAQQQRQRDLERLRTQRNTADNQLESAAAEADRLDVLLEAIRLAPSRLAERQAAALGDLGPVTLEFGDNPAVVVRIDGRPWWLASRGRQVVADMHLRAALRRAFGLKRLPLVVDNVQDVGGQPLPPVDGPVILLRTTDDNALSIDVQKRVDG
ncbi:MAG: AAA family ATPase [Myxococcota bacterium]